MTRIRWALIEGGVSGDIISFHIGAVVALQTATWSSGTAQQNLPLTAWNLPGAFSKTSPADAATSVVTSPTLSWGTSSNAVSYEYCYATSASCITWTSVGSATSIALVGLNPSTTYYWQVRAVNPAGNAEANTATWWSFTTLPPPPGAFSKASPADGAVSISASPTLTWLASSGATSYEYCYDTSNNSICDGTWVTTGTNLSVALAGLNTGRVYYWQVRAVNAGGTTYANAGTMWAFTTVPTFADVPYSNWAWNWIERLYRAGVTNGCGWTPLIYCPSGSTTRAEMAKFLERGKHYPVLFDPPPGTGLVFSDVPISHWAVGWIEQLFADGITTGCILSPLQYCPENKVTRAEMAAFLLRAKHGAGYVPPPATGIFADVPIAYWAAAYIEQLYAEGITTGCNQDPLVYCPLQQVTRAEMAAFLVRTFSLP